MILKIAHFDQWWLYDNIARLRYNKKKIDGDDFNEYLDKVSPDLVLVGDIKVPTPVIEVCFRTTKDEEKIGIFQGVGYLCNDSGQTIEKLVP